MFPYSSPKVRAVLYDGFVYTVVLEADECAEAHAIRIWAESAGKRFWGVMLGHGLREGAYVRVYVFFGD